MEDMMVSNDLIHGSLMRHPGTGAGGKNLVKAKGGKTAR